MQKLEEIFKDPICYILQLKCNSSYIFLQVDEKARWQFGGYESIADVVKAINSLGLDDFAYGDLNDFLKHCRIIKKFKRSEAIKNFKDLVPELFL